ncbi:mannitol dehydrogenase family protein [Hyphomonas sp.]|uniref:mannitol dehydrogenase family protein n=1 Tax=Hyphomonas sp. TaxID=87 RepID=UPI003F726756
MTLALSTMQLNNASLANANSQHVGVPAYDRSGVRTGVLHIGPGAFHRAHQADYLDRLLASDPRWGIHGVSMKSAALRDAVRPQDDLYTLAILDEQVRYRVIGAMTQVSTVEDDTWRDTFRSPDLQLVTLTVTEKGYCLGADDTLDFAHPDIAADLPDRTCPSSVIGLLVEGLRLRHAAGLAPLTVLSCDNLPSNGQKLRDAVLAFCAAVDQELFGWISSVIMFPCSMVDSITPATDDALRQAIAAATGFEDNWPIQREAFTSWVIEDRTGPGFPDLSRVGAIMTNDVEAHEKAKLRLLNGAHSTLAYLGLALGHQTVSGAMQVPALAAMIDAMMHREIAPGLRAPEGLDLDTYRHALLKRFRNPAIAHRLSQIAWDGSKKLPMRLLDTIAENLGAGRPIDGLATGVAAWMRFLRRSALNGYAITDPLADRLIRIGAACTDVPGADVARFMQVSEVFPQSLVSQPVFVEKTEWAYARIIALESGEEQL